MQTIERASAASALRWWLESGVDIVIDETPRNWLKATALKPPATPQVAQVVEAPSFNSLEAFRSHLELATGLPFHRSGARRVLPTGGEAAPLMMLSDVPGPEEAAAGKPIAGEAWILATRMLAAIGLASDDAYLASLSCFHGPGSRLSSDDLRRCGELARHHVRLARPERLLLMGDIPARALLGQPLAQARGKVHRIEGVRAVATFTPRWLLQRPSDKALAWKDLLLLMSDEG